MQSVTPPWNHQTTKTVSAGDYILTPSEFTTPTVRLEGTLAAAVNIILPEWPGFSWTFNNQTNNTFVVKVKDFEDNEITLGTGVTTIKPTPEGVIAVEEPV